ncbi:alkaline exonuclease [Choristoneura murinana nucleopolyhedrovirus]|uniref:Alkaline exonuclease n=1 Tax=Choristoneura murinana nucleopolyhedrovirus TaxID=1987479 RepID=V9XTN9_9ABAC|nr:alkaline exonuclease [Choristoneura murinana nucleopolyhedrovirus]AHD25511.1 alkaline exonuclease [Choristoneura murinana nucleopolyhedrovirus]BBU37503.1 alkaline exonuclease [Choristoneura diversana nucleopolyhedrovirus]
MHASLTAEQRAVYDKYKFATYARSVTLTRSQIDKWCEKRVIAPPPVSRDETLRVEAATRGQSKNALWNLLRLDRSTASRSSGGVALRSSALAFGNAQETQVKVANAELFERLGHLAAKRVGCAVAETVLDCGMFISALGLHSASPDAYFAMADGSWVPVEIKCPFNYRDTTVDQMRLELGKANRKYRVKHTALLVNKMGPPQFEVVKTHDHYRQMQRQMYVMRDAPVCFYVVRFKQNLVALAVPRDDEFCSKEAATEGAAFVAFAMENAGRAQFKRGERRRASFALNAADHAYDAAQVDTLVRRGLYLLYGQLRCAHCDGFVLDGRAPFETAMAYNHEKCDGLALQEHQFDNASFLDFDKRYTSLVNIQHDNARALAVEGYYADSEGAVKTFCCGVRGSASSRHHLPTCSYHLAVIYKSHRVI